MTKMTILHFASPFAFSMPVVAKDPVTVRPGEHTQIDRPGDEAIAMAGSPDATHDHVRASGDVQAEDDRLGASVLDTVLQRYRAHEAGAVDFDPSREEENRSSPSS